MTAIPQPAVPRKAASPHGRAAFLRFDFDLLDVDGAVAWLRERRPSDPFGYVVTPNVDHAVSVDRDPERLEPLYRDAALCLCDSRVLVRVARACGVRLRLAPGSDLTPALFERVLDRGDRVCVVGSSEASVARLRERYPDPVILHCPAPMGLRRDPQALARTAEAALATGGDTRFWLLAVGAPQQEMLARRMSHVEGATGTALCIGASIDFLTGEQRRAPVAVQQVGLEWAWRLLLQPRRLARRYLVDGPAVFPLAWRWSRRRGAGS